MLGNRQDELSGQWHFAYLARIREFLALRWMDATMDIKNLPHAAACSGPDSEVLGAPRSVAMRLSRDASSGSGQYQC